MEIRVLGTITDEEKSRLESLNDHFLSLMCLVGSLSDDVLVEDESIYQNYIEEVSKLKFNVWKWWDGIFIKYDWKNQRSKGEQFRLDVNTNEVLLIKAF